MSTRLLPCSLRVVVCNRNLTWLWLAACGLSLLHNRPSIPIGTKIPLGLIPWARLAPVAPFVPGRALSCRSWWTRMAVRNGMQLLRSHDNVCLCESLSAQIVKHWAVLSTAAGFLCWYVIADSRRFARLQHAFCISRSWRRGICRSAAGAAGKRDYQTVSTGWCVQLLNLACTLKPGHRRRATTSSSTEDYFFFTASGFSGSWLLTYWVFSPAEEAIWSAS